jgi:hypothetical protein
MPGSVVGHCSGLVGLVGVSGARVVWGAILRGRLVFIFTHPQELNSRGVPVRPL